MVLSRALAAATSIFTEKLDTDVRQPVLTFDLAYALGGPKNAEVLPFGIVLPNPIFWIQLIAYMILGALLGCIAAIINYNWIIMRRRQRRRHGSSSILEVVEPYLVGFCFTIPICLAFPYMVISTFNVRNYIIKFCLATIMPVLTIFHTMEAMFDTSPPYVESKMSRYALYSASPLQVVFDEQTKCPAKAKHKDTVKSLRDFGLLSILLGAYQSIFGPMGYVPFSTHVPIDSMEHTIRDLFALGHLGNNLVAALLLQLYLTAFCLGLKAVTNLVVGVETKQVMSNALFDSSSPSDFWGRKWNTLIHGVLKRAMFKPVVRYFPKPVAAAAAFVASGLFHEWILSAIFHVHSYEKDENGQCMSCYHPAYGQNLTFFLINAAIIALEYKVGGYHLFTWIKTNFPRPLVSILVVSTALPFAHLFTSDYIKSDYFSHGNIGFPSIVSLN